VRTLRRQCGVALAGALAIAAVLPATALGTGGGEEMESMAKQPARVLAQQAIAILRVLDDPEQALDRLDAAVESKDQEDVDTALLREADEALEAGDSDRTVSLLDRALSEPLGATTGKELHESGREFTPAKGAQEVVAIAVGGVALLLGGALLLRLRRPAA
jgi:hypothetical protein